MCDCEQKNQRLGAIESAITSLQDKFEEEINKKFALEQAVDLAESEMTKIENNLIESINTEKDPETGKAKYSNQQQRDIALFNSKEANTGYQELHAKKSELTTKIRKSNNELEIMGKKLRINEMKLTIEQMRR